MDAKAQVLRRSGVTLAAATVIVGFALWFNGPSEARVDFDVVCRSLTLPTPFKLNVNNNFTQIAAGSFFGFEGSVRAVSVLEDLTSRKPVPLTNGTFALKASVMSPSSYLHVTPEGALGSAVVDLDAGVVVTATPDGGLRLESNGRYAVHVVVQSDRVVLKGERYELPPTSSVSKTTLSLLGVGQRPGLFTELRARSSNGAPARADLAFARAANEINLLEPTAPTTFGKTALRLVGARGPTLVVEGRSLSSLERDRVMDITFETEAGAITDVALILNPREADNPRLRVSGWVRTGSVRQGRAELLPTWIEETLETSNLERSLWVTGLGIVAFVLFKAVDGTLDALLKLWIGE